MNYENSPAANIALHSAFTQMSELNLND